MAQRGKLFLVSMLPLLLTSKAWSESTPIDLKSAFLNALKASEGVSLSQNRINQSLEKIDEAQAALLPKANFLASHLRQDQGSGTGGKRVPDSQTNARVNVVQPLYHGSKESAAKDIAVLDVESQKLSAEQTKINVYRDTAQAYFAVLAAEADYRNVNTQIDLTNKRIKDLKEKVGIGRSRRGDLLAAETQAATLRAQSAGARSQVTSAREAFALITGLPSTTLLVDIRDLPQSLPALQTFYEKVKNRPDVKSLEISHGSYEKAIEVARAGYYPSLDLSANLYLRRSSAPEDGRWDVSMSLTMPIFDGFLTQSQVREIVLKREEHTLIIDQTKRQAYRDIESAFHSVESGLTQMVSLAEALKIAETNYKEQVQDYQHGLTTNLEVLQALNASQDVRRTQDRTLYQTVAAWHALRNLVGETL